MKSTITEMKKSLDELKSRSDTSEKLVNLKLNRYYKIQRKEKKDERK